MIIPNNVNNSPINRVIKNYGSFLSQHYPDHCIKFTDRLTSDSDAAKFEAVMYSLMENHFGYKVEIAESTSSGGADFIFSNSNFQFVLEATHIETETVSQISNIEHAKYGKCSYYSYLTHKLRSVASKKANQLSDYDMPRILSIGTFHSGGSDVLEAQGTELLLHSELKFSVQIDEPIDSAEITDTTDLNDSVFFRIENGIVEPCRQSISAILLVPVLYDCLYVRGILHPEPKYVFNANALPDVPFCKVKHWPVKDSVSIEWINAQKDPDTINL
ncbi:MAG: hypothetical protein ABIH66_08975 [bacterium]